MERISKVANDPLPVASPDVPEIEMELGDPAKPECSRAEFWCEFDQSVCPSFSLPEPFPFDTQSSPQDHGTMRYTVSEPSDPSTVSGLSTASSAWSTGSFHSVDSMESPFRLLLTADHPRGRALQVSELSAGPSTPPTPHSKWVVRIRKGTKRTTGPVRCVHP